MTSAYRIFKSFGRRFKTALPPGLIFDSALPPKGDIKKRGDVRFVPKADIRGPLLYDLIGTKKE